MTLAVWIGALAATAVVVAALVEAYLKRGRHRRLVDMRPDPERMRRKPWDAEPTAPYDRGGRKQDQRDPGAQPPRTQSGKPAPHGASRGTRT